MLIDYLFLSFPRNNNTDSRYSYSNYYGPKIKINDFNALIDGKTFFDLPVKTEEEAYEKIIEMSDNNDYTTGNLLDFAYFKKHYRLIAIDLSKQTKLKDPKKKKIYWKTFKKYWSYNVFYYRKIRRNYF